VKTASSASQLRVSQAERGFSMIEVMISIVILSIGLLSMLSVFGIAMAATQTSRDNAIAKQLANETMEGILTARETANITWTQIQNTGSGGIFLSGFQPIYNPGVDGIIGTADDAASGFQTLELPGPSGVFAGNCPAVGADICQPLTNFTRQIAITPVLDQFGNTILTLRAITITVQYNVPQFKIPRQYVLNTFISPYR